MSQPRDYVSIKRHLKQALYQLTNSTPAELSQRLAEIYHQDATWRGSHPLNEMQGLDAIAETFWLPLLQSFPDLERRDNIFIGGTFQGKCFVGAVGHYCGTFRKPWLGIPATGRPIYLRYGEFHEVEDNRILQSTVLIDVLDVMRQAGYWPLPISLGTEGMWPGPITADGVFLDTQSADESAASIAQTLAMHQSLADYDDLNMAGREGLMRMSQKHFWHPKMMWYGPAGIGTTRGLQGFVDYHQLPFRIAFPNRTGVGHYVRIGDGKYSATSGWPSVHGKHLGGGWLGTSPTGKDIYMRVMDFYLHHEGLIRENWIPLDIIHVLLQMDIDIFARMDSHFHPEKYT